MRRCRHNQICCILALLALLAAMFSCDSALPTSAGESGTTTAASSAAPAEEAIQKPLALPFASRDVLNPFLAETQLNLQLAPLIYESLFAVDDTFEPIPVLAKECIKETSLQYRLTLRTDRVFQNGAPLTSADVAYSFQKAKNALPYNEHLANIAGFAAQKDGSLRITLKKENVFLSALLDFPIVPLNSAETKRFDQAQNGLFFSVASTPIGTGMYQLTASGGAFALSYNTKHPGTEPMFKTLDLYGVIDTSSLLYGLEMDNYQFAYDDLSKGTLQRVSATTVRVATTNLIYLGCNAWRAPLSNQGLRAALALCLNKEKIVSDGFSGFARATQTPFPPAWYALEKTESASYDSNAAIKALEDLGYNAIKNTGVRASKYQSLKFTLVYNEDNPYKTAAANAIKTQFQAAQVSIELKPMPLDQYTKAVRTGQFDFYLGEVRLPPDCALDAFLQTGGDATAGINVWGSSGQDYTKMRRGSITPAQFVTSFNADMPFIPIAYRDGVAVRSRGLKSPLNARQNNLFYDIADWHY
ncbi:MAG: ABC transporter substrate-binding protein [Oscillospiraceae bacterium]|nr:ABC transporter substrate-binding protein [Oscillospiraceae bacterium]